MARVAFLACVGGLAFLLCVPLVVSCPSSCLFRYNRQGRKVQNLKSKCNTRVPACLCIPNHRVPLCNKTLRLSRDNHRFELEQPSLLFLCVGLFFFFIHSLCYKETQQGEY